jgi:hypothetical protein
MRRNAVSICNGQRDNWKTTTPLQERRIHKALEGRRCPTDAQVIKILKAKEKEHGKRNSENFR